MVWVFFEDCEAPGGGFVAGLAAGDGAVNADFVANHEIDALVRDGDDDMGIVLRHHVEDARSGPGRVLFVDEFAGGLHPRMIEKLRGCVRRAGEGSDGQEDGQKLTGTMNSGAAPVYAETRGGF